MKILFAGDTVLNHKIQYSDEFIKLIKTHDHCILNLEAPLTNQTKGILKAGPNIKSSPEYIDSLREAFDCVTLANNHTMDYGINGLTDCINHLNNRDIMFTGAGKDIEDALKPIKLGNCYIFSVCENEFGSADKNTPGVATFDHLRQLYNLIQYYKKIGEVIICYHGGSEIIPIPPRYIVDRFHMLLDFGVSLVIAHHPHVVQGYEANIFYSLGNFCFNSHSFDQYKNSNWSLLVSYDTDTKNIQTYHTSLVNNTIILTNRTDDMEDLNILLKNPEYENLSNILSIELYNRWYPNELKNNIPLILHYLRCDAHKNNLISGLSYNMQEIITTKPNNYHINIHGLDSFEITKIQKPYEPK